MRQPSCEEAGASLANPDFGGPAGFMARLSSRFEVARVHVFLLTCVRSSPSRESPAGSIQQIAQRYSALRPMFSNSSGVPTQWLCVELDSEFTLVEAPRATDEEARKRISREALRRFCGDDGCPPSWCRIRSAVALPIYMAISCLSWLPYGFDCGHQCVTGPENGNEQE